MKAKVWVGSSIVALGALMIAFLALQPSRAQGPFYVAPGGDDMLNDCQSPGAPCATVNGAIARSSAWDTVYVATGTYTSTETAVVLVDRDITISGGWDSSFSTQEGTSIIDGDGSRRGMYINQNVTVVVERFTVQHSDTGSEGGGIYNAGTLTLDDAIISGNTGRACGGIYNGYYGTLTANRGVVSGNTTSGISGTGGGVCTWRGTVALNDSTISDNTATGDAGGIYNDGGTVILTNSTVSGNNSTNSSPGASGGGGIFNKGGSLTLTSSTVSGNEAASGGGGVRDLGGTTTLQNTVIAANTASGSPDCAGIIGTLGHNLLGDASDCMFTPGAGDLTGVDAGLGPLVGSPGYHPLIVSSPARDAVPVGQCTVATDQRGVARPQGPACDMGAYEYTTPGPAAGVVAVSGTPQRTPPSSTFWTPLEAAVLDSVGSLVSDTVVTFAAPASGASGTFADSGMYTTTAVTDERGVATAAAFTASGLTGSYTVTATVYDVVAPATFYLGNGGWYVATDGSDGNDCQSPGTPCATVNGALGKAGFLSGDTVLVGSGTYAASAGDEVVLLDKNVRLYGGWDGGFSTQSGTSIIDGGGARRGLTVDHGATVIVEYFAVRNGACLGCTGGGVHNKGTLILDGCTIYANTAEHGGGGIYNDRGTVTLDTCAVSDNAATGYSSGGGIENDAGTLVLNSCVVSGNDAGSFSGGGIRSSGTTTLSNSTVSGNRGGRGGGIYNGGTLMLYHSTVTENKAIAGGGISGGATLRNSILAGNEAYMWPECVGGSLTSAGYNLVGDTTDCNFTPSTGDLVGADPQLGPLIGLLGYHPLLPESAARDAVPLGQCAVATDQRGVSRPQGPACDIGAYEYTTPGPAESVYAFGGTPQRTPPLSTFWVPLQAAVLDGIGSPVSGTIVTFAGPASGVGGTFADSGTYTTTAVTDERGVAAAAAFTANELTGSYTVTATVSGVVVPATFYLGNGGWYVAADGSDGNDCRSPGTPCATISGALGKAGFLAGDTVLVASGTYAASAGDEVVLLDKSARLYGGWDGSFSTQSGTSAIDGGKARTGVTVDNYVIAQMERFVIQNGRCPGCTVGGITIHRGASLILSDSAVSRNMDCGIQNDGELTLNRSVVTHNVAGNHGAGIANVGTATLNNSVVSNNTAEGEAGGISNNGLLVLNNSSVSSNLVSRTSGGTGGIGSDAGTVILNNSTVSGNTGTGAGGIGIREGTAELYSSTVTDNTGGEDGGGIGLQYGSATLRNTILAGNTANRLGPDCHGEVHSAGYNLIGSTSGCTLTPTTGDQTNVHARLDALTGSPPFHPLLSGSPTVNAGGPSGCVDHLGNPLLFDQRGMPRMGRCDIGAYEYGMSASKQGSGTYAPGEAVAYIITLDNDTAFDVPSVLVTDTLPSPLTYVADSLLATSGIAIESENTITWSGWVPAGGTTTIRFRATVSDSVPSCSLVTNEIRVSAGGGYEFRRDVTGATPCVCNVSKYEDNPVLSAGAEGSWDSDDVWGPVVLREGNAYRMWYTSDDGVGPSQIGLATSSDGIHWTKSPDNPVLSPSETWEVQGVQVGDVISESGLYKMWYTAYDRDWVSRIGFATSADGVTWAQDWLPSLDPESHLSWEAAGVRGATEAVMDGIYHLWYTGSDGSIARIGHLTSSGGSHWFRDAANPVLDVGPPGGWDWLGVYAPDVVQYGDTYILWYSGETLPQAWQTGYALSVDGSWWTRGEMVIPEGPSGAFDANSADDPSVMLDGSAFKIWYSGHDGSAYGIGYATADLCGGTGTVQPPYTVCLPIVLSNWNAQYPCPAYYSDSFDDATSGWPVVDNSDGRLAYTGGQYQIWLKRPYLSWMATPGAKASDFAVAVSARRVSSSGGAYGVIFGISNDWSELYEVIIESNRYSIWKYDSGWSSLRGWTPSGYIDGGTGWNRLKVIRDLDEIAIYINNYHMTTIVDASFTGLRRIGLVAYAFGSGPLDARFDDFALYPASCGMSAAGVGFEMGLPEVQMAPAPPERERSP